MFAAFLEDVKVWRPILQNPVLRMSLAWLEKYAETAGFGDHSLGEPNWYANVHGYTTLPEAECGWENHTQTIDIQYLVSGSEGIRWAAVNQMGLSKRYIEDKDRQEFDAPSGTTSLLHLYPGMFAVFLPGDAHCPKITLSKPEHLRKVVVKIPVRLLYEQYIASSESPNNKSTLSGGTF